MRLTAFKQLIPHYTLLPNYMDIHEYNRQNNEESIFEIQFGLPGGTTYANKLLYKADFAGTLSMPRSHFTGDDGKIINTCGKIGWATSRASYVQVITA